MTSVKQASSEPSARLPCLTPAVVQPVVAVLPLTVAQARLSKQLREEDAALTWQRPGSQLALQLSLAQCGLTGVSLPHQLISYTEPPEFVCSRLETRQVCDYGIWDPGNLQNISKPAAPGGHSLEEPAASRSCCGWQEFAHVYPGAFMLLPLTAVSPGWWGSPGACPAVCTAHAAGVQDR